MDNLLVPSSESYLFQPLSLSTSNYSMPMLYRMVLHLAMIECQVSSGRKMAASFEVKLLANIFSQSGLVGGVDFKALRSEELSTGLMRQVFTVRDSNGVWREKLHWVNRCFHDPELDLLTIEISEDLRPLVLEYQKKYTYIELKDMRKFKGVSNYAWRYYEIFSSRNYFAGKKGNKPGHFFVKLTMQEIRSLFDIPESEYTKPYNFLSRLVDGPIKQLNATDCGMAVETKREYLKRKLSGFTFDVTVVHSPKTAPFSESLPTAPHLTDQDLITKYSGELQSIRESILKSRDLPLMLENPQFLRSDEDIETAALGVLRRRHAGDAFKN